MQSNCLLYKPQKAVVITKYHNLDITYERLYTEAVKCTAIAELCNGNISPFVAEVCFNVDPIFGKILWYQINISDNFCAGLSSWLFHHWRRIEKCRGERTTMQNLSYVPFKIIIFSTVLASTARFLFSKFGFDCSCQILAFMVRF